MATEQMKKLIRKVCDKPVDESKFSQEMMAAADAQTAHLVTVHDKFIFDLSELIQEGYLDNQASHEDIAETILQYFNQETIKLATWLLDPTAKLSNMDLQVDEAMRRSARELKRPL